MTSMLLGNKVLLSCQLCIIYCLFWFSILHINLLDARIVKTFSKKNTVLYRIAKETRNQGGDYIYVGALNSIYILNEELGEIRSAVIGPKVLNNTCLLESKSCQTNGDILPQSLLVLPPDSNVLLCATLYDGYCLQYDKFLQNEVPIHKSIVSNNANGGVVALLSTGEESLLHIGSSHINISTAPLFATRSLESLDLINSEGFTSALFVRNESVAVIVKDGFEYNGYLYFFIIRKDLNSQLYKTWLVRICKSDLEYDSYIEVPLECKVQDYKFYILQAVYVGKPGQLLSRQMNRPKDVLFTIFSEGGLLTPYAKTTNPRSAVCMFSMDSIHQHLQTTVGRCFQGDSLITSGPYYLTPPALCEKDENVKIANEYVYCGDLEKNRFPLEGPDPIINTKGLILQGYLGTSLVVKDVNTDNTVAYIRTRAGSLLKYRLDDNTLIASVFFGSTDHNGSNEMKFSDNRDHIFLMNRTHVLKIQLYNCSQYLTCQTCQAAKDPHCGWCAANSRCTTQSLCTVASKWLAYSKECPGIVTVDPHPIAVTKFSSTPFSLVLNQPLDVSIDVHCFATWRGNTVQSNLVLPNLLTARCDPLPLEIAIPHAQSSDNVTLAILLPDQSLPWAEINVTVFDCSKFSRCSSCTGIGFKCIWCVETSSCINEGTVCPSEIIQDELAPMVMGNVIQLKDKCPYFEGPKNIKIPAGIPKFMPEMTVGNLPAGDLDWYCKFNLGEGIIVKGSLVQSEESCPLGCIQCAEYALFYDEHVSNITISMDIYWGEGHYLENKNNFEVELFRCDVMATSCSICMVQPPVYECVWCDDDRCGRTESCSTTKWEEEHACRHSRITNISPNGGTITGNTALKIEGVNLGIQRADISQVLVGSVDCIIQDESYIPGTSFVCLTGPVAAETEGRVLVRMTSNDVIASQLFKYVSFENNQAFFWPRTGPYSGGTLITINGTHLDKTSSIEISIDPMDGQKLWPCKVQRLSSHAVQITTPSIHQLVPVAAYNHSGRVKLYMQIDNSTGDLSIGVFVYQLDPTVSHISPSKTIIRGGTSLSISGTGFDQFKESYYNPLLIIYFNRQQYFGDCKVKRDSELICMTPNLTLAGLDSNASTPVDYGLKMDNVTWLLNLTTRGCQSKCDFLQYYPNPVIYPFASNENSVPYQPFLTIHGIHLGVLMDLKDEFYIYVGKKRSICEDPTISNDRIVFTPPLPADDLELEEVLVVIAGIEQKVGFVDYRTPPISSAMIIGLAVGICVPLLLILILLAVCRVRRSNRKRPPPAPSKSKIENTYIDSQSDHDNAHERMPLNYIQRNEEEREVSSIVPSGSFSHEKLLRNISGSTLKDNVKDILINPERLLLGDLIGKGHFGQVYGGILRNEGTGLAPVKVAVKTIQDNTMNTSAMESFLKEGLVMKNFSHPHVLQLMGIAFDSNGHPMMVLPFMAKGDLRSYVKNKEQTFTARDLLQLARQVAEGMAYLGGLNFVHRDLAARNCMIDECDIVKVADFGLSRQLLEKDYYSAKDRKLKLPVKWMALESLDQQVFTTKTDVWSFGVLMWELMTRGITPYPDVDAFDLRDYLATGHRLRKPKFCPEKVYDIMLECWNAEPILRPTFVDLVNRIELILNPPRKQKTGPGESAYVNLERAPSRDYLEPAASTDNMA